MDAYCERQGKSPDSVRFLYDGERVQPTDTPQKLEMEDGDAIDVMIEQLGGLQFSLQIYLGLYCSNTKVKKGFYDDDKRWGNTGTKCCIRQGKWIVSTVVNALFWFPS